MSSKKLVIILHGLGNSSLLMSPLSLFMKLRGFTTLNIAYPSTALPITKLSEVIRDKIDKEINLNNYDELHFIGFSLGSQIFRLLLSQANSWPKGRLVMLGPPNQNCKFARWLKPVLPTAKIWGPAFEDLCSSKLPNPCFYIDTAIIAGGLKCRYGFNPLLKEDNDGLVTVIEAKLDGAKHMRILFCPHAFLPLSPSAMILAHRFLSRGDL